MLTYTKMTRIKFPFIITVAILFNTKCHLIYVNVPSGSKDNIQVIFCIIPQNISWKKYIIHSTSKLVLHLSTVSALLTCHFLLQSQANSNNWYELTCEIKCCSIREKITIQCKTMIKWLIRMQECIVVSMVQHG